MVKKKTSVYEDFDLMDDLPVSESKTGEIKSPHKSNDHYSVLDGQTGQVATTGKNNLWLMFLIFLLFLFLLWLLWMLFFKDKAANNETANNEQQQEQTEDGKWGWDMDWEGWDLAWGDEWGDEWGDVWWEWGWDLAWGNWGGDLDMGWDGGDMNLLADDTEVGTGIVEIDAIITWDQELIYDNYDDEAGYVYSGWITEESVEENLIAQAEIIEQRKVENSRKVLKKISDDLTIFEKGTDKFLTGLDTQNVKDKFEEYQKYKAIDIEQLGDIVKYIDIEEEEREELEKDLEELSILTEEFYGRDETVLPSYENKLSESLGVEKNDVQMSILIEKWSQLPSAGKHTYTTRKPYQRSMFFNIYQWEDSLTANNKFLWRLDITGLNPIANMWSRVEVEFDLDKNGKLSIHAEDILDRTNNVSAVLDTEIDFVTKNIWDIKKVEWFVEEMDTRVYRILEKVEEMKVEEGR